jgi:hypothetical protein
MMLFYLSTSHDFSHYLIITIILELFHILLFFSNLLAKIKLVNIGNWLRSDKWISQS